MTAEAITYFFINMYHYPLLFFFFFFFNDTATTEIYTLSLYDALPIFTAPIHRRGCDHLHVTDHQPLPVSSIALPGGMPQGEQIFSNEGGLPVA